MLFERALFVGCSKLSTLKVKVRFLIWTYLLCLFVGVSHSIEINKDETLLMECSRECCNMINGNISSNERQSTQEPKCETYGCVKVAAQIVSYINDTINPCDNFYQFANGHYINDEFDDTDDDESRSFYYTVSDLVNKKVGPLLSEPLKPNEWKPFDLAKNFYKSCINQPIIVKRGNQQLIDILESLGGWPFVKGKSWRSRDFNLNSVMKKVKELGFDTDIIFGLDVDVDPKNTNKRLLQISSGNYAIDEIDNKKALAKYRKKMFQKSVIFIEKIDETTRARIKKEVDNVLALEIKLIKISSSDDDDEDEDDEDEDDEESFTDNDNDDDDYATYPISTIKELQESYPYLNWLLYINAILPYELNVTENEPIMNLNSQFFEKLGNVINSTSPRTMANYILWRAIYKAYQMQTFERGTVRRNECINLTAQKFMNETKRYRFSIPVGLLYSRKYFNEKSRQAVIDLVEDVRGAFIDMLRNVTWMDDETRETAIVKAKNIVAFVGYPTELYENYELSEYYQDLEIDPDDFFRNSLRWDLFNINQKLKTLRQLVNRSGWEELLDLDPTEANAFYSPNENIIEFPVAILHELFFAIDRPQYINYASLGNTVGHEITHGFDDNGRRYDLNGTLINWWNLESKKNFTKKTKCFVKQYNSYIDPKTNLTIDGENTLDENIADNGGTRAAYYAYLNWIERNGPEKLVPGVKYNQRQLFWISYAQAESSVSGVISLKHTIENDEHAPGEFRINGVVSNLEEFASDFNCPVGTKMNPSKKCRVW